MSSIPRVIIAGTQSGVGKTSLTLGLVTLLRRKGLRVQAFKVGPDYLDPGYLALASGRTCYNLDGWMMGRDYVEALFQRASADADIAVIEGVMGLFDGASPESNEGSTAEIASWLRAPVLLVANAHGMARSFAALVKGYCSFDPNANVAGIIANRCGSERHGHWISESLRVAELPPLVGTIQRDALQELTSRHLGLITADRERVSEKILEQLADVMAPGLAVEEIVRLAQTSPEMDASFSGNWACGSASRDRVRLGIARDEAFHFYYPDNLEALQQAGCELVPFSPVHERELPQNLNGLYIGGGYPEESARTLSENQSMRRQIAEFSAQGGIIYAECGGLMYLSEGIESLDGSRYTQVGLLPVWTRMCDRRKTLGYVEVTLTADSMWGQCGAILRGHEFHYSELQAGTQLSSEWKNIYRIKKRGAVSTVQEGFAYQNILASYVHLHFASHPEAVDCFVRHLETRSFRKTPQPVRTNV